MIRFIDMTHQWCFDLVGGTPMCAFWDTTTCRFIPQDGGSNDPNAKDWHCFEDMDEVRSHPAGERLAALVPEGFFERNTQEEYDILQKMGFAENDNIIPPWELVRRYKEKSGPDNTR